MWRDEDIGLQPARCQQCLLDLAFNIARQQHVADVAMELIDGEEERNALILSDRRATKGQRHDLRNDGRPD